MWLRKYNNKQKGKTMTKKKIERWFYLQLQLMLNMYMRRGNPQFTYDETHTKKASKSIRKFDIKNKNNILVERNLKYWNSN